MSHARLKYNPGLISMAPCRIKQKRREETGQENPDVSDLVAKLRAKGRDNGRYAYDRRIILSAERTLTN